jgi:hypothetical protein
MSNAWRSPGDEEQSRSMAVELSREKQGVAPELFDERGALDA